MAIVRDEIKFIDPETKTIEYASGRSVPLSEEAAFQLFATPSQQETKKGVKESELEAYEKGILPKSATAFTKAFTKRNLFAKLATDYFLDPISAGYGALTPREGQQEMGFFDRLGENYLSQRMGRREAVEEIEQKHPTATTLASILSLGTDIAMPLGRLGRSPTATGALFGAGSSDRSLFEDPEQFAKSTATGAALGFGIGKTGQTAERIASERRALREFPEVEREAQRSYQQQLQNFRTNVGQKLGAMNKDLGKFGIPKEAMALDEFINREIGVGLAGTQEGQELRNFFTSIGQNLPETLNAQELQKLYEAIELRAARGSELELPVLQSFKEHLVERLPSGAAQNKLMAKVFPKVERETSRVIDQVFEALPKNVVNEIEKEFGKGSIQRLKDRLSTDLKDQFNSMNPQDFVSMLHSGDVSPILNSLTQSEVFQNVLNLPSYKALRANPGLPQNVLRTLEKNMPASVYEAQTRFQNLPNQLQSRLENIFRKNALDASLLIDETQKAIASRLSNATGVQNPYVSRPPTNVSPGPYRAPQAPQVGALARRFETQPLQVSSPQNLLTFGLGAVGKLVGLPKIGGAIAAGKGLQVGLEGTLRGITSPTALGNLARQGIRGGGMKIVVEQIASSYPSYDNGVLKDPSDRKRAVAEIETDPDIPYEDKAMLQAYINRGKSLENLIRE